MPINRLVAQKLISDIPTTLRSAARKERQFAIKEHKADPIGASYQASHGAFPTDNNQKLQEAIAKIKADFQEKGIMGLGKMLMPATEQAEVNVVRASSYIA